MASRLSPAEQPAIIGLRARPASEAPVRNPKPVACIDAGTARPPMVYAAVRAVPTPTPKISRAEAIGHAVRHGEERASASGRRHRSARDDAPGAARAQQPLAQVIAGDGAARRGREQDAREQHHRLEAASAAGT